MFLRDSVQKNWKEANLNASEQEVILGNTGMTMSDMRQYLYMQVVIALQNYNPDNKSKAKESTFVHTHLFNRIGQHMKKLTKEKSGYGKWAFPIEDVTKENSEWE
jgi:hypothetical protein